VMYHHVHLWCTADALKHFLHAEEELRPKSPARYRSYQSRALAKSASASGRMIMSQLPMASASGP
jgi:hypothetical protein